MDITPKMVIEALEKKIGYSDFAKHIIIEALKGFEPTHQSAIDHLDELKGVEGFWEHADEVSGDYKKAETDKEKIEMINEAIEVLKSL